MEPVSLAVETLTLLVDIGILWILIEEFNYDKIQDERKEYKRRKVNEKRTKVNELEISQKSPVLSKEQGQDSQSL